ncbi:MAG: tRNA pseudouridine(13) synthase TruD, partial [Desulfurococcales archaeon]|nr:tRNA pseudouridine(13) synthase TruD [Desulfurococcales archaeon]
ARGGGLLGLKDACAYATQYMALRGKGLPDRLEAPGLRAWLLGEAGPPRLGLHRYNIFRITLRIDSPIDLGDVVRVPGFYGPQRFGVARPNTHYLGLLYAEARMGGVIREYLFRYPLEERRGPGSYEARELEGLSVRMPSPRKLRIMGQALQSYIFNRALSRALQDPRRYAEHYITVECMGTSYRVPAARLPGPRLRSSKSVWARLVGEVLAEEGLSWQALRGLRSPFRPLLYPVCSLRAKSVSEGIMLRFALPRGAYATSLLRELVYMDWLAYDECRLDGVKL